MRCFLDMCIILYYIGEGGSESLIVKSKEFINQKGNNSFILCHYIKNENLPKWLKRQRILFRELIRQIQDKQYEQYTIEETSRLYERDKKKILKLKLFFRKFPKKEAIKKIQKVIIELDLRINNFLGNKIDEFVIPINEIDFELKSHLLTFLDIGNSIKNDSDAKTIASAIQAHKNKTLVVITADKKDWTDELFKEAHNHPTLRKKYPQLPQIKYL